MLELLPYIPALALDTFLYTLRNENGDTLLHLSKHDDDGARMAVAKEEAAELRREGEFKDVALSPATVFVGSGIVRAGEYSLTIFLYRHHTKWDVRDRADELIALCCKTYRITVHQDGKQQTLAMAGVVKAGWSYDSHERDRITVNASWRMAKPPLRMLNLLGRGFIGAMVSMNVIPGPDPDGSGPLGALTHITIHHGSGTCEIIAANGLSGVLIIDARNGLIVTINGDPTAKRSFVGIPPGFRTEYDVNGAIVYGDLDDPANIVWTLEMVNE
jgi:hypothetical protein